MSSGKSIFGIFLLFAGAFLLLERLHFIDGDIFLVLLGGAFFAAYFANRRSLGFLIPGSILTWFGLYTLLMEQPYWEIKDEYSAGLLFVAMGMAFLTIFIHTIFAEEGTTRFWPLYPGLGLIIFALIVEFEFSFIPEKYLNYIETYWPALIMVIGLALLLAPGKRKDAQK